MSNQRRQRLLQAMGALDGLGTGMVIPLQSSLLKSVGLSPAAAGVVASSYGTLQVIYILRLNLVVPHLSGGLRGHKSAEDFVVVPWQR